MATTGYIFLSGSLKFLEQDREWMSNFGCDTIIEEERVQEKLRPQWRELLSNCKRNDVIVLSKLSNAVRGIRELGAFLDLYSQYNIRLISIHDKIDSEGILFPSTTAGDILKTIGNLSAEVAVLRKNETRAIRRRKDDLPRTFKATLKINREKTIIKMYGSGYSIDDIWKVSGYKSRTSVFRVLNRHNVSLNRGRRQSSST